MLKKLVELHPRGTMQTDRNGKLPFHLSCESGKDWDKGVRKIYEAFEGAIKEPEQNTRQFVPLQISAASPLGARSVISKLAKLYPEGAKRKDSKGRFALHWACESGKEWETGIEAIFNANPMANICADNGGLLPFHIAALKYCWQDDDCRPKNEEVCSRASFHERARRTSLEPRRPSHRRVRSNTSLDGMEVHGTDSPEHINRSQSESMPSNDPITLLRSKSVHSNCTMDATLDVDAPKIEVLFQLLLANPQAVLPVSS